VLRLGFGGILIVSPLRNVISLPFELPPTTGRQLKIIFEIPIDSTPDEKLLKAVVSVRKNSSFYLPKYKYELCFEDTNENFFDQQGRLRNLEEINLRWTLINAKKKLEKGNPVPFFQHITRLQLSKLKFVLKKVIYNLCL
jgi:hypothetical protein